MLQLTHASNGYVFTTLSLCKIITINASVQEANLHIYMSLKQIYILCILIGINIKKIVICF